MKYDYKKTLWKMIPLVIFLLMDVFVLSKWIPTGVSTLVLSSLKDYLKHNGK